MKKMNTINPDKEFPQVEKMIYSQAWKYARTYPVPFEETKSVAYAGFMYACSHYKKDQKTKFGTYCYFIVGCKLKDLVMERSGDPLVFVDFAPGGDHEKIEDPICETFSELVDDIKHSLSEDANAILALLIETPGELLGGNRPTPRQLLSRVKKKLIAEGKKKKQVEAAQHELHQYLRFEWS